MPVIDFHDSDQFDAAVAFLAGQGIAFHARPPQCLVVRTVDYEALKEAKILPGSAKANGSRGKKTRPTAQPKAGRAS